MIPVLLILVGFKNNKMRLELLFVYINYYDDYEISPLLENGKKY
jgi:hypothetical protein